MNESMSEKSLQQSLTIHWIKAQPILRAYLGAVIRNDSDADDLLQRVALTVIDKFDQFDADRPFTAWAMGIARNHVLDHLRKARNDRHLFGDDLLDALANTHTRLAGEYDERCVALRRCINELDDRGHKLLELRYVRGLKPADIAERFGLTPNAIRIALHRLRTALGKCIERRLVSGGGVR